MDVADWRDDGAHLLAQADDLEEPLGCDDSDEPRTDGKSSLDLFRESCEAADRARREENK